MKRKNKTFRTKLWLWFLLFAVIIFAALWLIQTVFLQGFYLQMTISDLRQTAEETAEHKNDEDFLKRIETMANEKSLLIFLTDDSGNVLYSVDEYSFLYGQAYDTGGIGRGGAGNPYISDDDLLNWEKGAIRNLPYSHRALLEQLLDSEAASLGRMTDDASAYVYGCKLLACGALEGKDVVMCISMPLTAVDAAARVLRIQLLWVSVFSLFLAALLAFFISRKFERPIYHISQQAQKIAKGDFQIQMEKGFCRELDALSDTLQRTADSLERLENARREMLASISHDLRTPLTMIKGYAEMVETFSWRDDEKRKQDLAVIQREADRLTALVNEILDYTSMQKAGDPVKTARFNISDLVETIIRQFQPLCSELGYQIERRVEPHLWIVGNERALERVMYNFVDNAINHTSSSHIMVTLQECGEMIRFAVQDEGQGIPAEDIPYVWDRYYTSRNRKNKQTVSGLGLSISKQILTEHGAQFGVENDGGCTFWFELPKSIPTQN